MDLKKVPRTKQPLVTWVPPGPQSAGPKRSANCDSEGRYNGSARPVDMQYKFAEPPFRKRSYCSLSVSFVYEPSACSQARATTRHPLEETLRGGAGDQNPLRAGGLMNSIS